MLGAYLFKLTTSTSVLTSRLPVGLVLYILQLSLLLGTKY